MADVLAEIARFATNLDLDAVPARTRALCADLIADSVACTVGALAVPEGRAFARALHGSPAPGYRAYETGDAFAGAHTDAYLANLLDFDDVYEGSGHIGCVIVPPVLRLAARRGATGVEAMAALVAGLEIGCRLAEATRPTEASRLKMWGIGARIAPAAAAAAARIQGLPAEATAHALALACATAPVASVRKTVYGGSGVTWVKNNMGIAASAAVSAALMAGEGARGPLDILDGDEGFARMIGTDTWKAEAAAGDLGTRWAVDGLGFKAYPCCRHAHGVIDAALAAHELVGSAAAEIDGVLVAGPVWIHHEPFNNQAPATMHDAQYSLPFILAVSLLGLSPGRAWFEPGVYGRDDVRAMASRVHTEEQPAPRARVTIRARGTSRTVEVDAPKGSPSAPMTAAEIEAKHRALLEPLLAPNAAQRLLADLRDLARSADVRHVIGQLPAVALS